MGGESLFIKLSFSFMYSYAAFMVRPLHETLGTKFLCVVLSECLQCILHAPTRSYQPASLGRSSDGVIKSLSQ